MMVRSSDLCDAELHWSWRRCHVKLMWRIISCKGEICLGWMLVLNPADVKEHYSNIIILQMSHSSEKSSLKAVACLSWNFILWHLPVNLLFSVFFNKIKVLRGVTGDMYHQVVTTGQWWPGVLTSSDQSPQCCIVHHWPETWDQRPWEVAISVHSW